MNRIEIPLSQFLAQPLKLWSGSGLLLTAGDFQKKEFNMMTVGWGSFGTMWGKPFAQIVVRPQRYTIGFLEKFDTFTLSAFPESCRGILQFCGSKSGKDFPDKAAAAGATPMASGAVAAPGYEEAELVIECRKSFRSEMKENEFLNSDDLAKWYPAKDYHVIYFGEILRITATEKYLK